MCSLLLGFEPGLAESKMLFEERLGPFCYSIKPEMISLKETFSQVNVLLFFGGNLRRTLCL